MSNNVKLFFTEQVKLSDLTLNQLNLLLKNGESTIYVDSNNILRLATKENSQVVVKNAVGDIIKTKLVNNIPTQFPSEDTGYALMAVRNGSDYKLLWGSVDTKGNYNVIIGSTTYTITLNKPLYQIYDANTPDDYKFNGTIVINVNGDGANAAKKYSIDGGINFTEYSNSSVYAFTNLGGLNELLYNLVIKDSSNSIIYSDTLNFPPIDYTWELDGIGAYAPDTLEHLIYKSDDFNSGSLIPEINIVITESDTTLPGVYEISILVDDNPTFNVSNVTTKNVNFQLPFGITGDISAIVTRTNARYIKLGELTGNGTVRKPNEFLYSKDYGYNFLVANYTDQPMILDGTDYVYINYYADETSEDKKIYMLRNSTNEIYQTNVELPLSNTISTPINNKVTVNALSGVDDDLLFSTPFNSNDYKIPTIIDSASIYWGLAGSFIFKGHFISTQYSGAADTELKIYIENLSGDLILAETSILLFDDPINGMYYEFNIIDFISTILPYNNQIVRIRFVFDSDTLTPTSDKILSKLKYVRFDV